MTRSQNPNVLLLLFLSSLLLHSSLQCTRPVVSPTTVAPAPPPAPAPVTAAPTTTTTPPITTTACVPLPACDNIDVLADNREVTVTLQGYDCPTLGALARATCADIDDIPETDTYELGDDATAILTCSSIGWTGVTDDGLTVLVDSVSCE